MPGLKPVLLLIALLAALAAPPARALEADPPFQWDDVRELEDGSILAGKSWLDTVPVTMPDGTVRQVTLEQRIIIRIPRLSGVRRPMSEINRSPLPARYTTRKAGKCVAVSDIAAVQVDNGNRLLLFMRDRSIIRAELEKACLAREFYSGFYVERSEDGQMCVARDLLQARSGAKCELDEMRLIVPED